jgi:hypothetical protein
MLRRLLIGLVLGLIVGGALAAALVAGLGLPTFASIAPGLSDGFGSAIAYLAAAITGVLTGLVAGKPIWTSGAKVEAGLKALFGALIGAGLMFALRRWAGSLTVDLPAIGARGQTAVGDLPAVSLPLLAAVLGGFFELDNTGGNDEAGKNGGAGKGGRQRIATGGQATARQATARPAGASGAKDDAEEDDEPRAVVGRAKH